MNDGIPVKDEDFPLTIRNMRPGDRMETAGGTKKVSRLFINAKIPSPLRRYWPVVLDCRGNILLVRNCEKQGVFVYQSRFVCDKITTTILGGTVRCIRT